MKNIQTLIALFAITLLAGCVSDGSSSMTKGYHQIADASAYNALSGMTGVINTLATQENGGKLARKTTSTCFAPIGSLSADHMFNLSEMIEGTLEKCNTAVEGYVTALEGTKSLSKTYANEIAAYRENQEAIEVMLGLKEEPKAETKPEATAEEESDGNIVTNSISSFGNWVGGGLKSLGNAISSEEEVKEPATVESVQ